MTPLEIENAVWKIEKIRISLKVPADVQLGDYDYTEPMRDDATVDDWKKERLMPTIMGYLNTNIEVILLDDAISQFKLKT